MAHGEKDSTDRDNELPRAPDGYIRRSTLLQAVGACVGLFGAVIGGYGFIDRMRDAILAELHNERIERINEDSRINERIDSCCQLRRRY